MKKDKSDVTIGDMLGTSSNEEIWANIKPAVDKHIAGSVLDPVTIENDQEFQMDILTAVEPCKDGGWTISHDGWCFFCPASSLVTPVVGMRARFYGRGIGYTVRGLALRTEIASENKWNTVFYLNDEDSNKKHQVDTYGADAADWLARWDSGETVWTIPLTEVGPGHEQTLHIVVAEFLRHFLTGVYDDRWGTAWDASGNPGHEITIATSLLEQSHPVLSTFKMPTTLWSAAALLASKIYLFGPIHVFGSLARDDKIHTVLASKTDVAPVLDLTYQASPSDPAEMYGKDAADWLARWDAGQPVWSISMGGMGPGYEQALQTCAAQVLRHLLDTKYDHSKWEDKGIWEHDRKKIENWTYRDPTIDAVGPSGAMMGAAMSLATKIYMFGPVSIMANPDVKDRHIQVSKTPETCDEPS